MVNENEILVCAVCHAGAVENLQRTAAELVLGTGWISVVQDSFFLVITTDNYKMTSISTHSTEALANARRCTGYYTTAPNAVQQIAISESNQRTEGR